MVEIESYYKNKIVEEGIRIEDNLEMGVQAVRIGPIEIASATIIVANSVLTKDVKYEGCIMVGVLVKELMKKTH
ncbi:hypothetical protein N9N66_02740 [Schleiferiaceae bacterium]|nr:hypothetical protein [Schleiferiaceae bacterium]